MSNLSEAAPSRENLSRIVDLASRQPQPFDVRRVNNDARQPRSNCDSALLLELTPPTATRDSFVSKIATRHGVFL